MLQRFKQLTSCIFGLSGGATAVESIAETSCSSSSSASSASSASSSSSSRSSSMGTSGSKKAPSALQASLARSEKSGVLSLSAQKLKEVPEAAFKTTSNLRFLDLSTNRLLQISPALGSLVTLQRLSLAHNRIAELPSLQRLTKLKELNAEHNLLSALPEIPPSIVTLALGNNRFTSVPESVFRLPVLVSLDLANNAVTRLDCVVEEPQRAEDAPRPLKIRTMNFDRNRISELGTDWTPLRKLVTLSLEGNKVSQIPPSLLTDTALANLSLAGNPITKQQFLRSEGVDAFMARRKKVKDKGISGGLHPDTGICGLTD